MKILLNTVSNDEHVPEAERYIRTVKGRTRSIYNTVPFKKMPARMIIELVYYCIFCWNAFPPKGGISKTTSPRELITGMKIDYEKHCQLEFGEYVQVHEDHDNSMATRSTGAIALRPTGNAQGGYYFFSLSTGRRLNRNNWTALPMPNEVIDRVHKMARKARNGLEYATAFYLSYHDTHSSTHGPLLTHCLLLAHCLHLLLSGLLFGFNFLRLNIFHFFPVEVRVPFWWFGDFVKDVTQTSVRCFWSFPWYFGGFCCLLLGFFCHRRCFDCCLNVCHLTCRLPTCSLKVCVSGSLPPQAKILRRNQTRCRLRARWEGRNPKRGD